MLESGHGESLARVVLLGDIAKSGGDLLLLHGGRSVDLYGRATVIGNLMRCRNLTSMSYRNLAYELSLSPICQ